MITVFSKAVSIHRTAFDYGLYFVVSLSTVSSIALNLGYIAQSAGLLEGFLLLMAAVLILAFGAVCSILLFFPTSNHSPFRKANAEEA